MPPPRHALAGTPRGRLWAARPSAVAAAVLVPAVQVTAAGEVLAGRSPPRRIVCSWVEGSERAARGPTVPSPHPHPLISCHPPHAQSTGRRGDARHSLAWSYGTSHKSAPLLYRHGIRYRRYTAVYDRTQSRHPLRYTTAPQLLLVYFHLAIPGLIKSLFNLQVVPCP